MLPVFRLSAEKSILASPASIRFSSILSLPGLRH